MKHELAEREQDLQAAREEVTALRRVNEGASERVRALEQEVERLREAGSRKGAEPEETVRDWKNEETQRLQDEVVLSRLLRLAFRTAT